MELAEEIVTDVEEMFPPKPGGMIDRHRKAEAARKAAQAEQKDAAEDISNRAYKAVKTAVESPEAGAARTMVVSSATGVQQLLGADELRRRATVITLDQPIVLSPDLASASDSNNPIAGSSTTGASVTANGSVTDPGAFAAVAFTAPVPAGLYEVTATVFLTGTVTSADANNMQVVVAGGTPAPLEYPGTVNVPVTTTVFMRTATTQSFGVQVINAASGSSAVYNAIVSVTPVATSPSTVSASGFVLPVNTPLVLESRHEWFVTPTSASPTRVSVLTESYSPGA
jgi:hypothetical protein